MHNDHKTDARAAFAGLIIGAIVLFSVIYTIVRITNASYSSHSEASAATP